MITIIGKMLLTIGDTQPDVKQVLQELEHCIEGYRDRADSWYGGMIDVEQVDRKSVV